MSKLVLATLVLLLCAGCAATRSQLPLCESVKRPIPQDKGFPGAAVALKQYHEQWGQDVQGPVDPASLDPDWPSGFGGSQCVVLAHNETTIPGAVCARVISQLVDARRWPEWYSNAANVSIDDGAERLNPGTKFRFTTFGSPQTCEVRYADHRVSWSCTGQPDTSIHHRWYCTETGGSTLVSTQECQKGLSLAAANIGGALKETMQRGHQVWLESLKCR